jgi:hypothetical protein
MCEWYLDTYVLAVTHTDAGKVIKGLDVGLNGNLASFLLVFLH